MRPPIFNLGEPQRGSPSGFSLLGSWVGAGANAQKLFFSQMRSKVAGMPLLEAGMQLAEAAARQRSEFATLLIDRVERVVSARGTVDADTQYPQYGATSTRDFTPGAGGDTPQSAPVLRMNIAHGTQNVAVPLLLRNHRQYVDVVSLSVDAARMPGVATIPTEFISFDPAKLAIPPMSEGSVQLLLRTAPHFLPVGEFWAEIVIEGNETKRIPLVLQVHPDARSADGP